MYAIREMEQNPARATIKDTGTMIQITLPSYLPDLEQNLLYTIAWPRRDIMDRVEYIYEKTLLPTIKKILRRPLTLWWRSMTDIYSVQHYT